ncbi:MAG TPA: phosphatidylglycerol lysyltransferase domain-containing protein [Clostridia bacterium]|nr:phosphatidylglycerol lysyltransferase domain-containing protein [Clostridia bacterium]
MDFRSIDVSMKSMVEGYTRPWKLTCSEYTFTNLLIWGAEDKIKLAEEDGALFFLLDYGEGNRFMFAPLTRDPAGDYVNALNRAVAYCRGGGIAPVFRAVSGPIREAFLRCPGYSLEEDRDNFDYVYTVEGLRDLAGKKLHAKRNHINQFMAQYAGRYDYVRLNPDMLFECMELYNEWLSGKPPDDPDAVGEYVAIRTLITHMDELSVVGAGIRIDGRLRAYTLGERIDEEMAVVHIEKADADIPGLFTVVNNLFVRNEFAGLKYVNREEDMGLEGLRRAKLSYNPAYLIEKYIGRPL